MTKSNIIRLYYLQDEIDKYESLYGYKISGLISNDTSYLTKYLEDNRNAFEYKSILKEYCCEYYEMFHPENQITIGINPGIVLKEITLAIIISIYNKTKQEKKTDSVFFSRPNGLYLGIMS